MKKNQKVLQPQYVQKFQCIGGDCEDNCCSSSWNIFIDKATYELYEKCPVAQLRQKLSENILIYNVDLDNAYAKFKMDTSTGCCSFLDDEKFCSIQRSMGNEYLSVICEMYPRCYNIVNGILEKSMHFSCPEAARLALLNTNLMEFHMTEEDTNRRKIIHDIVNINAAKKIHRPEQYFIEIRSFSIYLIQNRCYPLWQRLVILGMFCDNLNKLINENKHNYILRLIDNYSEYLKQDVFRSSLKNISSQLGIQITLVKRLIAARAYGLEKYNFADFFVETMKGINYSEKLTKEELIVQYEAAYEKYYKPVVDKHEYILENYLVNYVFMELFPFKSDESVFDDYIILIVHYAMIKMMLIGMAGFYKEDFNIGHVLKLIQSFTKVVTHDSTYLHSVIEFLRDNKFDNMAHMAVLIKN